MNVYPFIEAEKTGKHNVKRACELLEVSRSAYYEIAIFVVPPVDLGAQLASLSPSKINHAVRARAECRA